jgi:hypothetical protein
MLGDRTHDRHVPAKILVSHKRHVHITMLDSHSSRETVGDVGPDHIKGTSGRVQNSWDLHWVWVIRSLEGLVDRCSSRRRVWCMVGSTHGEIGWSTQKVGWQSQKSVVHGICVALLQLQRITTRDLLSLSTLHKQEQGLACQPWNPFSSNL